MKTVKYLICIENLEIQMNSEIEISKKEFNKQLSFLRSQVKKHNEMKLDYFMTENKPKTYNNEKTTEIIYSFVVGCARTDLIKVECKEGYYFITKNGGKKL